MKAPRITEKTKNNLVAILMGTALLLLVLLALLQVCRHAHWPRWAFM
jgi:inner membrane protein involved in colicin E2 resistance